MRGVPNMQSEQISINIKYLKGLPDVCILTAKQDDKLIHVCKISTYTARQLVQHNAIQLKAIHTNINVAKTANI